MGRVIICIFISDLSTGPANVQVVAHRPCDQRHAVFDQTAVRADGTAARIVPALRIGRR